MKKGVTLIEVLITSLILVIVISGTLMTFVYCQRRVIEDTNIQNASIIINENFEEIQRKTFENAMNDIIIPRIKEPETIVKYLSDSHPKNYFLSFRIVNTVSPIPTSPSITSTMVEAIVEWDDVKGRRSTTMQMLTNNNDPD